MSNLLMFALLLCNALSLVLMYLCVITPNISDSGKWFTVIVSGIVFIMTWVMLYIENQHIVNSRKDG
jgi:hypothetical protein